MTRSNTKTGNLRMKPGPLLLSDSKRKLGALLDKLGNCVKAVSDEACEPVFLQLADFAREALLERSRRMERARSTDLVQTPLMDVTKRIRTVAAKKNPSIACCTVCSEHYRKEQRCDECGASFRWCYTGYSRKPCEDPLYPYVGEKSARRSLCGDCPKKKIVSTDGAWPQQQDYLRIVDHFTRGKWKWISCLCDGSSVVSVSGASLEGLLFLLLPFYCQLGTEHSGLESRQGPRFHAFVVGCANEALLLLANDPQDSVRVQYWRSVSASRELGSKLGEIEFDFAWEAIANCLIAAAPTFPVRICIWECKNQGFESLQCYGACDSEIRPRMINILKWNPGAVTHYDLIVPIEDAHEDSDSEESKRTCKKVQL